MMPQFTPIHLFSARWPSLAIPAGSQGKPQATAKARAVAISTAAEDDKPAPRGTSPESTPSQPVSMKPASCRAQATPLRYSIQWAFSWTMPFKANSPDSL